MPDKKDKSVIAPIDGSFDDVVSAIVGEEQAEMDMEEALTRFSKASLKEAKARGSTGGELIPEGEAQLVMFKGEEIRKVFYEGEWWFAVTDVVGAITESTNPRRYWSDLKRQLIEKEGNSELYEEIVQLPMPAADGKSRLTDAVNTEALLRIIQSIPSPRAEPFKRWLAKVGYERIQEVQNPEILIKRAILQYQLQGRSDDWIEKRIRSIVTRKELTSEWAKRGVDEGTQYATLTNMIHMATFGGVTVQGHKQIKQLKSQNLRDHMTDLELIFTMLGEKSTTEIAQARDAQGFLQNRDAAKAGGAVAGNAREQLERETKFRVVSSDNFKKVKREADPERLTAKKN
ncbi:MAG: BRO family protein [Pseudomonadota bacterium]